MHLFGPPPRSYPRPSGDPILGQARRERRLPAHSSSLALLQPADDILLRNGLGASYAPEVGRPPRISRRAFDRIGSQDPRGHWVPPHSAPESVPEGVTDARLSLS